MDDRKLKELLKNGKIEPPSNIAKDKAISFAMVEFRNAKAENKNFTKGTVNNLRLIDIIRSLWGVFVNFTGGKNMQNRSLLKPAAIMSVLAIGVSLIAINDQIFRQGKEEYPASSLPSQNGQFDQVLDTTVGNALMDVVGGSEIETFNHKIEVTSTDGSVSVSGVVAPSVIMDQDPQQQYYHDFGRDKFQDIKINPVKLVAEEPVSTFSIDVDTASYSYVRRMINNGALPQKDAIRLEELINYFDYDYKVPADKTHPFEPNVAIYQTPWNKGTKLVHIGIKGYDILPIQKPRSNLVFLIDASGSMNSPDKLPLVKNALKMMVDNLSPEDTIGIVVYAGNAGTVLEPTKIQEKSKIIAAIDRLKPGGSTAGGEGIEKAYSLAEANFDKNAVNRVILATDGDFNVGITDTQELKSFIERKRKTGIFLSILGFGEGNYNDELMQILAQNGNGNAAYVDNLNEARKVLVDEASSTLFAIAKDVKIQVEFNPEVVSEYRLVGYENRLLNREDFNNDKVDAGEIGSGHEVTAIYEVTPKGSEARLIDDLRYGKSSSVRTEEKKGSEYAFLKIRYKLPDSSASTLITRPITTEDEFSDNSKVSDDMRFASSVAAFGQLLRGDPYTGNFTYDDVVSLAESAKGSDKFGYRSEFVNLVRLAKSLNQKLIDSQKVNNSGLIYFKD